MNARSSSNSHRVSLTTHNERRCQAYHELLILILSYLSLISEFLYQISGNLLTSYLFSIENVLIKTSLAVELPLLSPRRHRSIGVLNIIY